MWCHALDEHPGQPRDRSARWTARFQVRVLPPSSLTATRHGATMGGFVGLVSAKGARSWRGLFL